MNINISNIKGDSISKVNRIVKSHPELPIDKAYRMAFELVCE